MDYDPDTHRLELTRRNVTSLTDKLDDPRSARSLGSGCGRITVRAIEDEDRTPGSLSEGVVAVTRSELVALLDGESVTVGGVEVVPVPDAAHYSDRPAGDIVMPSTGELRPGVLAMSLRHICEVCGRDEILTPAEAFEMGWDYPPKTGSFGAISPRTCGKCGVQATVWWALVCDGYTEDMLTDAQRATISRILAEPDSIMVRRNE